MTPDVNLAVSASAVTHAVCPEAFTAHSFPGYYVAVFAYPGGRTFTIACVRDGFTDGHGPQQKMIRTVVVTLPSERKP